MMPLLDDIFDEPLEIDGVLLDLVYEEPAANAFCPTGQGGGVDPTCSGTEGGGGGSKRPATVVGKAEHVHSGKVERSIAKAVGGEWEEDNKPYDARVPGKHAFEVKSLLKGKKQGITVHDDALLRKVDYAKANPKEVFHTVAVDERATYAGGEFKEHYSGHRMYYKRGSGKYSLSKMHPVKDEAELQRLVRMKDEDLPEKARGRLPSSKKEVDALRVSAGKAHAARLQKDRARKARLKAEREQ